MSHTYAPFPIMQRDRAACHLTAGQLANAPAERRGLNGPLDVISAVHKADPTE